MEFRARFSRAKQNIEQNIEQNRKNSWKTLLRYQRASCRLYHLTVPPKAMLINLRDKKLQ